MSRPRLLMQPLMTVGPGGGGVPTSRGGGVVDCPTELKTLLLLLSGIRLQTLNLDVSELKLMLNIPEGG